MKYRTRLYLGFTITSVVSGILALSIVYERTKSHLFEHIREQLESIPATTAALIDPALLMQVRTRADENSAPYHTLQNQLNKVRSSNQWSHIKIQYLYIVKPDPNAPGMVMTLVDAAKPPEEPSHVGDLHSDTMYDLLNHLSKPYSPKRKLTDEFGSFLSGYAPIFDGNGNYIASVGADVDARIALREDTTLFYYAACGLAASIALSLVLAHFLSKQATESLKSLSHSVHEIGKGKFEVRTHLRTNDEFDALAQGINDMAKGLQERERLKVNFAHYVSQHVWEKIVKSERPMALEGERKKVTVLFSDIREFSRIAEQHPPEMVVALLNEYFETMLEAIFKYSGTLDKFIGDGVMVEFGAPLDDNEQEKHAVTAAIFMQKKLEKLNEKWTGEGKPRVLMGIGIHTGIAIVGNMGTQQRMEYTAIGDTVNIAARLEQLTKIVKKPILISEMTLLGIKDAYPTTNLGPMHLPGRKERVHVYSVDIETTDWDNS